MKNFIAVTVFVVFIGQALSRSICTDNYGETFCYQERLSCDDKLEIAKNCRKTCDTCQTVFEDDEAEQEVDDDESTEENEGTTISPDCVNTNGDNFCYESRHLCNVEGMEELKVICAKTCGSCNVASDPNPTTPNPTTVPCRNSWGNTLCRRYAKDSCHEDDVRRNCRRSCNACNEELPPTTRRPSTATPSTPTPSPAHDIPVEEIVECHEDYPDFCASSTAWCHLEDVYTECPIACGLCDPSTARK